METVEVIVYGDAQPAGSKRSFVHPHTKQVVIVDANRKAGGWKERVAQAAGPHMMGRPLLDGALALEVTFFQPRPKGHYGTGRNSGKLKDSAPLYPAKKPDTTKLLRGTEDALTGVIFRDDAQVVDQVAKKRYGEPARAEIRVVAKRRQAVGDNPYEQPQLIAV